MTLRRTLLVGLLLLSAQALVLVIFGQPLIAADGTVKLWEGVVSGPGNSQHLTDWYTFSHIIHGFIFYWLLGLIFPRLGVGARFALAVGVEVAWEIAENTPMVIQHYREQALAAGYSGDSVINSVCDTVAMGVGFLLAWRLPILTTVLIAVGLEAFVGYAIRDNLTLNVLNLIYQFDFIHAWQSGG
ncbi:DUF2585 domain-containing protein [Candidatus Kaiserbacteria bacterium]|nr:DUF2585 domain-containing protein [Candidatus Kaiserbacteria bacterium]